jgi:hypothetical protein
MPDYDEGGPVTYPSEPADPEKSRYVEKHEDDASLFHSLANMLRRRNVLSRDSYRFTSFPRD